MSGTHWAVTVTHDGEDILTIESAGLCGKAELTSEDVKVIREAGHDLLAFAGLPSVAHMNSLLRGPGIFKVARRSFDTVPTTR